MTDITFRQYMALTLIFSKFSLEKKYPTKEELKRIIEMYTDRMLEITLMALDKKGLIKFNGLTGNPIVEIPEENKNLSPMLTDKLMLINDFRSYEEIKQMQEKNASTNYSFTIKVQLPFDHLPSLTWLNNQRMSVHRWYSYLEDFPPSLVYNKLRAYGIGRNKIVLDPFVGSGTTVVTSKLFGNDAIGIDINPVASFVSQAKTEWTKGGNWRIDLDALKKAMNDILQDYFSASQLLDNFRLSTKLTKNMPKMELNQWLKTKTQNEVAYFNERIKEIENSHIQRVLFVALLGASVESSNVAFCPGTSFYPFRKRPSFIEVFQRKLNEIYEDLFLLKRMDTKYGNVKIFNRDCRKSPEFLEEQVDFIFTSPPYPNDLEYTRQTRLELFILDYVRNMEDVRRIKKQMVKGSTKLIFKESDSEKYVEKFESVHKVANAIEEALNDKKWGWDYPRMVKEYFGDMFLSLEAFHQVLRDDSYALLVVGDQTYKQIVIPVGQVLIEIARDLKFSKSELELLRVRRSTTHSIPLREEIVILKK
jgi:DNA modification methylase